MSRPTVCFLLLLLLLAPRTSLPAQWQWSFSAGSASVSGHARADEDPERPEIAPDHPAMLVLGLTRQLAAWRLGMQLTRTRSDLAIRGVETAVVTRGTLRAVGVGLEVGRVVAGNAGAPELLLLGGVGLDRWTFPGTGSEPRYVAAVQGALEGQVPLRAGWHGLLRVEGGVSGSLFRTEELPIGYETRPGKRAGIRLGVGWSR